MSGTHGYGTRYNRRVLEREPVRAIVRSAHPYTSLREWQRELAHFGIEVEAAMKDGSVLVLGQPLDLRVLNGVAGYCVELQ